MLLLRLLASDFRVAVAGFFSNFVTKLRLKPPSNAERSVRESSLLGGRCAAAKTASKASPAKTCFISSERGFRRCLVSWVRDARTSARGDLVEPQRDGSSFDRLRTSE